MAPKALLFSTLLPVLILLHGCGDSSCSRDEITSCATTTMAASVEICGATGYSKVLSGEASVTACCEAMKAVQDCYLSGCSCDTPCDDRDIAAGACPSTGTLTDPVDFWVMEAELREVLTPTPELLERAQRAQVASSSHSERHSLGNLLAQNQHLAARAGLSSWGECTWRPTGPPDENGTAQSGRRGVAAARATQRCAGPEVDFYSGWEHRSSPHWHFRSSSPRYGGKAVSTKSSRRIPPAPPPLGDPDLDPGHESEALPISSKAVEETRQAVLGAKELVSAGATMALPRGVSSVLRHALRMVAQSA